MTDAQLIQIFLPIIKNGLTNAGFEDILVVQNYQPTQQGISNSPTVWFNKSSSKLYGYRGYFDSPVENSSTMKHTETQWMESIWRINALVKLNPLTPDQYTASDLAQEVAYILQSYNTVVILNTLRIGILRISDVLNPQFSNDRDQFSTFANFGFTLTYPVIRESTSAVITPPIKLKTYPI